MNPSFEKFADFLPSQLKAFFADHHQYSFLFIGGATRDFLLGKTAIKDFDIEVRSLNTEFSAGLWQSFKEDLSELGEVTELSYFILKLKMGDLEFEFSPPRKESFLSSHLHKNFEPTFSFKFDYHEASLRRDFTINTIGFLWQKNQWSLIDPLGGVDDLKMKTLAPAGADFHLDPVRWLRLARFKVKLGFQSRCTITKGSLIDVSAHYFFSEMFKSEKPYEFITELKSWEIQIKDYPLSLFPLTDDFYKVDSVESFFRYLAKVDPQGFFWVKYAQFSVKKFKSFLRI